MISRRVLGGWLFVVSLRLFVALVIFQANVVAFRVEAANAAAKAKGTYLVAFLFYCGTGIGSGSAAAAKLPVRDFAFCMDFLLGMRFAYLSFFWFES
jgi:hypothetical protein